ncbi:MAG: hypothetical protein IJE25_06295 [Clostridia bacterium]|nr:hypothetical protein [Clostridia bacterium]
MDNLVLAAKINAIENSSFVQISGPNPLIMPGEQGAWDDGMCEMCDILKDNGKYYLYYHATGRGESYRVGVAVSDNPLGPFVKHGTEPILDLTFGDGNDRYIACGSIIKESTDKYYLFYSLQRRDDMLNYYIGLATADNPLGPFKKFDGNPIMKNFGYVGGVTKRDGKYYMFNEYPTRVQAVDYGHISYAFADSPEGPWTTCRDEPAMPVADWGTWDDAGYSECNVKFDGTLFHMFYGGAKTHANRLLSQESMGYAYSADGRKFFKYGKNPVAHRENIAYGAAMAECCFLAEYPYVYVYHTLRYTKPWLPENKFAFENRKFPNMEHIGVQVLSLTEHFSVSYQAFALDTLASGETYTDPAKLPLSVMNARGFALSVSYRCDEDAAGDTPALLVHVKTGPSPNALTTEATYTFTLPSYPGKESRVDVGADDLCARFMQVEVENIDPTKPIRDVSVNVTLVG